MKPTKMIAMVIVAVLMLCGSMTYANGKLGSMTGLVKDFSDGNPLSNAVVTVVGTKFQTATDANGEFAFSGIKPGDYTVQVSLGGFETATVTVVVRRGQEAFVSVELERLEKTESAGQSQQIEIPVPFTDSDYRVREEMERKKDRVNGNSASPRISTPLLSQPRTKERGGDYRVPSQKPGVPEPFSTSMPDEFEYFSYPPEDMFFRDYGTNRFIDARRDRFSTFALDVDDASYNIVRKYLEDGMMPPGDAIRVEEFINHFDYGYNIPRHNTFRVFSEMMPSPFANTTILKIGIKGAEIDRFERKPMNLTFVIDVSGSMRRGNRMGLVKQSLRMLLDQLESEDMIGIVAYGSQAYTILEPTPAHQKHLIRSAIKRLNPGGSTYAEAGLKLGYRMANRQFVRGHTNRIILCSDGVANVGQTSPDAIMRDIKRFANKGITLSTFGYGMGNYNDVLLERLALKGNGQYAYVNDREEARKLFVQDFVGNMELLARDVKVQVEFDPYAVSSYRLVGYENRAVPDHRFRDNNQDGGEVGAGHEITAVYELVLNRYRGSKDVGNISVRWTEPGHEEVSELSRGIEFKKRSRSGEVGRPELRLAVAATQFAELLKGTEYASESSFAELYEFAEPLAHEMGDEQTRELLDLIQRARQLTSYHTRR